MANIQKQMTDVNASLETNAFDLSERNLFSCKVGQLLPVYNRQVVPGDYFEIDCASFLRTMRFNTASFARMRQHIEFFFVPYVQLWSRFPEMRFQRHDPTSAYQSQLPVCSPYVSLADLYTTALTSTRDDMFGFNEGEGMIRLLDLLGYGDLHQFHQFQSGSWLSSSVPSDYQNKHVTIWPFLAYQKIYNDYYRNRFFDVNIDASEFNVDDIPCYTPASADIMTSRTNLARIMKLRYRQWKKDFFTGIFPDQQFGDVSMVIGSSPLIFNPVAGTADVPIKIKGSSASNAGEVVANGQQYGWNNNPLSIVSGISALDVRRSELLQIWKEKTMRAGYRSEDQQMAHFGQRSGFIPKMHAEPIGGWSEMINVSEVVSTSNTPSVNATTPNDGLGEMAGKGTSLATGSKIRFKCPDDGIIMGIFSILPESEYPSQGLKREHTRIDPFDYFTPALQNVGFEMITGADLNVLSISAFGLLSGGFAPPYYDMKMAYDKVHGEFNPALSDVLLNPSGSRPPLYPSQQWQMPTGFPNVDGSLVMFSTPRRDDVANYGTLPFFYVNPHCCDDVFAFNAGERQTSDHFYVNLYLDIKAVRPMSVLGLPNF